jgi:serine/threonine protein kinase
MTRTNGWDLRITDFGLARRIGSKLLPLDYGMPEFVAPEIILGHGVGYAADIWSVGVITYLLLSGRSLFRGRNDMETLDNIKVFKKPRK